MLKKYEKSCHRTKYNSLRSCFGGKSTLRQTVKPIICSNPAFAASKIAITSSKVVVYFQTLLLSTSLYVSIYEPSGTLSHPAPPPNLNAENYAIRRSFKFTRRRYLKWEFYNSRKIQILNWVSASQLGLGGARIWLWGNKTTFWTCMIY